MPKIRFLSFKIFSTAILLEILQLVYIFLVAIWNVYDISIQVDVVSEPETAEMHVYYKAERGYNGADYRIGRRIKQNGGTAYTVTFPYSEIRGFRIDPGAGAGKWIIKGIQLGIVEKPGKEQQITHYWDGHKLLNDFKPWSSIDSFNLEGSNLVVNANGPDPYFGYTAETPVFKLLEANPQIKQFELKRLVLKWILGAACLLWIVFLWKSNRVLDGLLNSQAWTKLKRVQLEFSQYSIRDQKRGRGFKTIKWFLGASNLHVFFLYLCLAIFILGANPFKGETVSPVDLLMVHSGYHSVHKSLGFKNKVVHWARGDVIDGTYPGWTYLKKYLREFRFPKWNLNVHSPINISILSILFNPTLLSFTIIEDSAYGIYLGGVLQLVIAGFGLYLLMRIFVSFPGAFFGGIVYMMSGFNSAWFFVLTTGIWIPWVFWATARYLESGKQEWGLGITLTSLCLILSYFYAVAGWTFYAVSLFIFIWNLFHYQDWKTFIIKNIQPILFIGLAFIIAFSSFLPTFDQLDRADFSYRFNTGPLPLNYLRLLVEPLFLGSLRAEYSVYTGVLSLALSAFVIITLFLKSEKKQFVISFFGCFLLFLTLSILFGLFKTSWVNLIPLFSFNPWNRLFSIIGFCFAILSALGLNRIISILKTRFRLNTAILVLFIVLLFRYQILDQKHIFNRFNAVVKTSWFYPETESLKFVKDHIRPLRTVIADGSYFVGGTLGVYGIPEWFGHNTYTDSEKKLVNELLRAGWKSNYVPSIEGSKIDFKSPLLNAFGVKYLLIHEQPLAILQDEKLGEIYDVKKLEKNILTIENLQAPSGAYFIHNLSSSPVDIVTDGVSAFTENDSIIHIESRVKKPGWLVLPIRYFPGWRASSGSKILSIEKYLDVFPAVQIDKSTRKVKFEYIPEIHYLGSVVTYGGVVLFLMLGVIFYKRPQKKQQS